MKTRFANQSQAKRLICTLTDLLGSGFAMTIFLKNNIRFEGVHNTGMTIVDHPQHIPLAEPIIDGLVDIALGPDSATAVPESDFHLAVTVELYKPSGIGNEMYPLDVHVCNAAIADSPLGLVEGAL